jgi:hypothetical protein
MRGDRYVLKNDWRVSHLEQTRGGRTGIVMVILENPIQDQLGALHHVFPGFAHRGPRNVFLFKPFFKDKVGELGLYF